MKTIIFFYIILFVSIIGRSQADNKNAEEKRIDSLLSVAYHLEFSDHDSSSIITEIVIQKSEKINYELGFADAILHKGYLREDIGEYGKATILYDSAIIIYNRIKDLEGLAKAKNAFGVLLNYQGKYKQALIYLQESYNTYNDINDTQGKAIALGNMGLVQSDNGNYEEALNYFSQALKIKTALNDSLGIAIDEMNIGGVYFSIEQLDRSLEHYYRSIEISRAIDDKVGIAYCLSSIGFIQNKKKLYNEALDNFQLAIEIQKSIKDKNGLANSYKSLGEVYVTLNQNKEAMKALKKGLELANDLELAPVKQEFYRLLSQVYEQTESFKEALLYHQLYTALKDSLFNRNKSERLLEIEGKYHAKLQKKEISDKEAKITEKDIEIGNIIEKENSMVLVFSIVIISILGMTLVVLFNFNKKRKLARELEKLSIVAREIENTVIIANQDGEIEWINESYTRRIGYNLEEFIAKFGKHLANAGDSEEIKRNVEICKNTKKPVKYALQMEVKTGGTHWIQTTLTPILDKKGEVHKFILIDSDITDIKIAEGKMEEQRDELIQKNKLITESIDYAKRIQSALLPSQQKLTTCFEDHFIFYQPKDIVSGDFYWLASTKISHPSTSEFNDPSSDSNEEVILFAVADCTGHGVPGALMSIIGMNSLNNIVNKTAQPKNVLETLSIDIHEKLAHQDHSEQLKDGIDIAFCTFKEEISENSIGTLQFSGAHNPLYLIRDNELYVYKSNRVHIGANRRVGTSFTQENISIQKGDVIYLFTDGFADQKGGKKGKKFYYKPFRQLLLDIHSEPMKTQKLLLTKKIQAWRGSREQIDDMLIWGIRF